MNAGKWKKGRKKLEKGGNFVHGEDAYLLIWHAKKEGGRAS